MIARLSMVAKGEGASRPSADSGASTTISTSSVSTTMARNASTGDGPRYASSVRRPRSTAWEPVAANSPSPRNTSPMRNSQRAEPGTVATNEMPIATAPISEASQPTR